VKYQFSLFVPRQMLSGAWRPVFTALAAVAALGGFANAAKAQILWQNDADYGYGYYDRYDRSDYDRGEPFYEPAPRVRRQPQRAKRSRHPEPGPTIKAAGKPQGPIVIAISIEHQHLKIYDANGLFAESPVSTGMRGHTTPMGAFSVIQKNKWHRSNIYSGAPMPYMQRITWSGIAMHAGVLPGYPASHGCIRMPTSFAMRMWGWTRMGARVVITPGDVTPVDFSHPSLITKKPVPMAVIPDAPQKSTTTPKADKVEIIKIAANDTRSLPVLETLELRLTSVADGHAEIQIADTRGADANASPDRTSSGTAAASPSDKPEATKPADDTAQPAKEVAAPAVKRTGHIAAFISRKTGRLYVRQNFEPLFDIPVTITGDNPLGTHIFTMRADKETPGAYRWSVVSLPTPARSEKPSHRKKAIEVSAPLPASSSPAEALDRITIPDEAMQQIAEAIAPGGSLIVSDQGLGDETGRGTDFIVPLR
jgi:lipoprotein-anchoring transpeptidase ErfK/SrfK